MVVEMLPPRNIVGFCPGGGVNDYVRGFCPFPLVVLAGQLAVWLVGCG